MLYGNPVALRYRSYTEIRTRRVHRRYLLVLLLHTYYLYNKTTRTEKGKKKKKFYEVCEVR